jgi:RNA 3'-terminal phosphate cyclase (ATP)
MIEVDGSLHSGSGTLLRYAVALATLKGEPLRMIHIRAKREKPGLRPQHLQAVRACSSFCNGLLEGDQLGSLEIFYKPGPVLRGGDFRFDIGTAGSTTMLAFTLIPLSLYADRPCRFLLTGGLFQDYAPSALHMQKVLLPLLHRMGAEIELEIVRPGYLPQGQGQLALKTKPLAGPLKALHMVEPGRVKEVRGISLASHLEKERVSERMAHRCQQLLTDQGYSADIEILNDRTALQKGATLLLWAENETGGLLGADRAGKPGRRSEAIAEFVVASLLQDLNAKATVDRHLADQLILFAALARGTTEYRIPRITDHVEANLWLVQNILEMKGGVQGNHIRLEGTGFSKSGGY